MAHVLTENSGGGTVTEWFTFKKGERNIVFVFGTFDNASVQIDISNNGGTDWFSLSSLFFIANGWASLYSDTERWKGNISIRVRVFGGLGSESITATVE